MTLHDEESLRQAFATLVPEAPTQKHLEILPEIAELPSDADLREKMGKCEDAAELQMKQEHVVRLESRPPNVEGRGEVSIRDLVINSLNRSRMDARAG